MINPNIDVEECRRLYETGHFPSDVLARLYCVPVDDIVYVIEYHGWVEGGNTRANMLMDKGVQRQIVNAKVSSQGKLQLQDSIGDDKLGVRDIVNNDTNMAAFEQLLGIDLNRRVLLKLQEKMGALERVDGQDLNVKSLRDVAETSKVSIEILRKIRQLDEPERVEDKDKRGIDAIEELLDQIENSRMSPERERIHVHAAQVQGVIESRLAAEEEDDSE